MLGRFEDIEMMKDVLGEAQMGMWTMEHDESQKSRMYADAIMLNLLGLEEHVTPEECFRVWYSNIDKGYLTKIINILKRIEEGEQAEIEYLWNHPSRGLIFIRCGGILDKSYTKGLRIRGYHQNITDIRALQKKNEYLEMLNEEILSSLHELFFAVYRVNPKTNSINVLRTPGNTSKLQREVDTYSDYIKRLSVEVWHSEDYGRLNKEFTVDNLLEMKRSKINRKLIEYRRKIDDEYRWVSITIFCGDVSEDWIIFAVQDIHEQKCREEKSQIIIENAYDTAKKATLAKNEFLSKMSHDIRTPMNAILGMTTLAVAHIDERERLENCLEKIKMSTKLMIQLINEVIDMSKIESGQYTLDIKAFKLSSLMSNIRDMSTPIMQEREQSLEVEMGNIVHDNVLGDIMRIQQVFMNIMSNANKYTPKGGHICVKVEELQYSGESYGKYKFEFIDNGIGMERDFLEHIFEPFSRTEDSRISKTGGTGLGMAIANSILQLMEGTIFVESTLGEGSRFTVILSLRLQDANDYKDALMKKSETVSINDLHLENKRILLVEDNEINLDITKEILEMSGAQVETAEDGKKAIGRFIQSPQDYYDIIFMDIQMPVMDGNEAATVIRSLDRRDAANIPIVAMTANAFIEDIFLSRQSGMNEHIAKPIDMSRIVAVLKKWVY